MEMKMGVDGVAAESGDRRMTSTYQNLRIRSLIYYKCDKAVWNLDLLLIWIFEVSKKSWDTCCSNFFVAHVAQVDEGLVNRLRSYSSKQSIKGEAESGGQSV